MLKKYDEMAWVGLMWLTIWTNGGFCWTQ